VVTITLIEPKKLEETGIHVKPEDLRLQAYYNPMKKYDLRLPREKWKEQLN
jgi:hypothetical protein